MIAVETRLSIAIKMRPLIAVEMRLFIAVEMRFLITFETRLLKRAREDRARCFLARMQVPLGTCVWLGDSKVAENFWA